jgi:hypothetical protein
MNVSGYDTTASFPTTGSANTLYLTGDYNRIYRWASSVYCEIGSLGGDGSLWANLVPGTPTGVTGTTGDTQISLTWTAPTYTAAAITDYTVQYSSNSGSTWTTFSRSASTALSATVTGLTNGTSYIFRVAAVSALGTGSYSTASATVALPAADASFSSVSTLLHFDGANASTTFTDSATTPLTWTANSGAAISTTRSQFGGASLNLGGSSYLTTPYASALDFGSGNFTVEWWQYWSGGNSIFCWSSDFRIGILANYAAATSNKFALCLSSTGSSWDMAQPDTNNSTFAASSVGAATNTWQHIALQRSGNNWQLFFDGTKVLDYSKAGTLYSPSGLTFRLGGPWPGAGPGNFNGYIDEFRITKGVARYSANFTPATTAFPNY